MKVNKIGAVTAAACLASALAPTTALAEESISGTDILIPKMGEFIPVVIAFLVIWVVLAKCAWPQILDAMDKREQKIKGDLDAAAQDRQRAEEQLHAYEEKMAGAQRDADAIIAKAKADAQQARERIVEGANAEASGIVERGRQLIESERRAAASGLTTSIAEISVNAAAKIIDENLDEKAQRKLVEKYLDEVGGFDAH